MIIPKLYTLNKKGEPIPATDIYHWWNMFEISKQRIVKQERIGKSKVSTVFLGIDHNFLNRSEQAPILWETMVFGGKLDQEQDRCSGSRKQAKAMHQRMVKRVKKGQI